MGFCRTRVCGQPPGGASIGRAFPLFLLLSPLFPSSCLCPGSRDCPRRYRWLPDTHTGLHPYGLRPGAARRVPHIRIIMPRSLAPLPRVLCHGLLAREKAGRKPPLLPAPCGRSLGHGPARSRESGKGHAFPAKDPHGLFFPPAAQQIAYGTGAVDHMQAHFYAPAAGGLPQRRT